MVDDEGATSQRAASPTYSLSGRQAGDAARWQCGAVPGVLRASLLALGEAVEGELRPHDLERGFFIGNAARGMVAAQLYASVT